MQELYALAEVLKPFRLSPSDVAAVGVGRGLDTPHVMRLVMLVCSDDLIRAKAAAIEAKHGVTLSEYQNSLFRNLLDNTEE